MRGVGYCVPRGKSTPLPLCSDRKENGQVRKRHPTLGIPSKRFPCGWLGKVPYSTTCGVLVNAWLPFPSFRIPSLPSPTTPFLCYKNGRDDLHVDQPVTAFGYVIGWYTSSRGGTHIAHCFLMFQKTSVSQFSHLRHRFCCWRPRCNKRKDEVPSRAESSWTFFYYFWWRNRDSSHWQPSTSSHKILQGWYFRPSSWRTARSSSPSWLSPSLLLLLALVSLK